MGYPDDGNEQRPYHPGGYQPPFDQQGYGAAPGPGMPPGQYPQHPGGYQQPSPYGQQRPGGSDDQTMALIAHLGGLLTGFIAPLIIYLMKKDESAFARHHAVEALNFQITMFIAMMVSAVLMFVIIGLFTMMIVAVVDVVFCVLAAVAANRGEWYRYPINIRMVS